MEHQNTVSDQLLNRRMEIYRDERKLLIGIELEVAKSFDSLLITLSGGALGIVFGFLMENFKSNSTLLVVQERQLLVQSATAFAVSLVLSLVSFLVQQKSLQTRQKALDSQLIPDNKQHKDQWLHVNNVLTYATLVMFVLGLVLISIFMWAKFAA